MQISFVGFQPVQSSEHMAVRMAQLHYDIFIIITYLFDFERNASIWRSVHVEWAPCGQRMLRHWSNDWNVVLGIWYDMMT